MGSESELINAILHNDHKHVSNLIQSGVDVNHRCMHHGTPIHAALDMYPPNKSIVVLLLRNGARRTDKDSTGVTAKQKLIMHHEKDLSNSRNIFEILGVVDIGNDWSKYDQGVIRDKYVRAAHVFKHDEEALKRINKAYSIFKSRTKFGEYMKENSRNLFSFAHFSRFKF